MWWIHKKESTDGAEEERWPSSLTTQVNTDEFPSVSEAFILKRKCALTAARNLRKNFMQS